MASDVGRPDLCPVDFRAERDEPGEGGDEADRVGYPGKIVQVLVRVLQDADPPPPQPVDQRQGAHPGEVQHPSGQQQATPGQRRRRPLQPEPEQHAQDGERSAPAEMRVPMCNQWRSGQHHPPTVCDQKLTDDGRSGDDHQPRRHGRDVEPIVSGPRRRLPSSGAAAWRSSTGSLRKRLMPARC